MFFSECLFYNFAISMNYQHFNDFDIESSFQEDENVVIDKPFIPAKPPKAASPAPRSTFKVIIFVCIHFLDNILMYQFSLAFHNLLLLCMK